MLTVRPFPLWPWLYAEPPTDDARPSFRGPADSPPWITPKNPDPQDGAEIDATTPQAAREGPAFPGMLHGSPEGVPPYPAEWLSSYPMQSSHAGAGETPHPWFNLDAAALDGGGATPGFRVEPSADSEPGFRMVDGRPAQGAAADTIGRVAPDAGSGFLPSFDVAAPQRDPIREALDQAARIYTGFGRNAGTAIDPRNATADAAGYRGDPVPKGGSPVAGNAFDPQYLVPVQARGGFVRPPPGPGHNNPPAAKGPLNPGQAVQAPFPQRPPAQQPSPETASAAAAAAAAAESKRASDLQNHREQLLALEPENPLLKLEPVPGVVPDQVTVDRHGEEVKGIVRKKFDQAIDDLRRESIYDQRSIVRTVTGNVDLRALFDQLKIAGKRVQTGRGQYGSDGNGEMYELPGGFRIGFRMANDTRSGENATLPTLDIVYPGRKPVRYHQNNQR